MLYPLSDFEHGDVNPSDECTKDSGQHLESICNSENSRESHDNDNFAQCPTCRGTGYVVINHQVGDGNEYKYRSRPTSEPQYNDELAQHTTKTAKSRFSSARRGSTNLQKESKSLVKLNTPPGRGRTTTETRRPPSSRQKDCDSISEKSDLVPHVPVDNLNEALVKAKKYLKGSTWQEQLAGVELCVQIRHTDSEQLDEIMPLLTRIVCDLLKSQRAQVVRTCIQAAKQFFAVMKTLSRPDFDDIVNQLLTKLADSHNRVRQDAKEALDELINAIPIPQAVRSITYKAIGHKNTVVRLGALELLTKITNIATPKVLLSYPVFKDARKRLLESLFTLMDDSQMEIRSIARHTVMSYMKEDSFDDVLFTDINQHTLKKCEKMLLHLRYEAK